MIMASVFPFRELHSPSTRTPTAAFLREAFHLR